MTKKQAETVLWDCLLYTSRSVGAGQNRPSSRGEGPLHRLCWRRPFQHSPRGSRLPVTEKASWAGVDEDVRQDAHLSSGSKLVAYWQLFWCWTGVQTRKEGSSSPLASSMRWPSLQDGGPPWQLLAVCPGQLPRPNSKTERQRPRRKVAKTSHRLTVASA